jgi:Flp pilus assembly protein TadB
MSEKDSSETLTVSRSDLALAFWAYVILAGVAMMPFRAWLETIASYEISMATLVFVLGVVLYPAWRLRKAAYRRPSRFLAWLGSDAIGAGLVFLLAWLSRSLR